MKTFALSLPEKPERITRAREHFDAQGLDVEFFFGLDAVTAGLKTTLVYGLDHDKGYIMGPKPVGIWLGHWALWSHISHAYSNLADVNTPVMILEDDAKFQDGWREKVYGALGYLKDDWDFLFPGHCCLGIEPERTSGPPYLRRTPKVQCNHCYIVRAGILPTVLRLMRKVWAPVDIQIMLEILPSVRTFAIVPRVVDQFETELPP